MMKRGSRAESRTGKSAIDPGELTHAFSTSSKRYTPNTVCSTERTAELNMCVMGDVTLMDRTPATQMRKPTMPCWCERGAAAVLR
jgi:hypothetical protein